jgi:F-type H+-transporting ATPase subunit epsilon
MATFHLDLVAPDKLTYSGEVEQVDVPGSEGDFGVLAGHAPLVAMLRPGILTIFTGEAKLRMVVLGGFAEVSAEGLTVLADVASAVDEFDRAILTDRISKAEENIKGMEQGSLLDRAIEQLDHFKEVDTHLQATAMH